jgi:shikimate dehydrogenase
MPVSKKRILGLLGYPVKHSFSPAMHNAAFKKLNIAAEYRLFEIKPKELNGFFASLIGQNISGLNVTIPYKEKVLDFIKLDKESIYLKKIRAVNTIVSKNSILRGFNTDIPGFLKDLKENNIDIVKKRIAMLGAGGAAKAVIYALANSGAKEISIYDIDKAKSQKLASLIRTLFQDFEIKAVGKIEDLNIRGKDLLINATPIGMKDRDPCLIKEEILHRNLVVYDLVYNPPQTKLLMLAKKVGAKTFNGLGMLLHQGALSFEYFTGKVAPLETMRQALKEELMKC